MKQTSTLEKQLRLAAETDRMPSHVQLCELSGYLLRRDIANGDYHVIDKMTDHSGFSVFDIIGRFLINENLDTSYDALREIKKFVADYYESEVFDLLHNERIMIKEEKEYQNPDDEYNPDNYGI